MFTWVFNILSTSVSGALGYLNQITGNSQLTLLWSSFIGVLLFGFLTYRLFLPALRIGQSDMASVTYYSHFPKYAPRRFRRK